jgi:Protein of unknown function (DUF664)
MLLEEYAKAAEETAGLPGLDTAQHAGHADIIRESLDGAKSMG